MADYPKTVPRPISTEELMAYMAAKNIPQTCPHCGHSEWETMDGDDEGVSDSLIAFAMKRNGDANYATVVRIYVIFCNHCGYIWSILRNAIEGWLNENSPVTVSPTNDESSPD